MGARFAILVVLALGLLGALAWFTMGEQGEAHEALGGRASGQEPLTPGPQPETRLEPIAPASEEGETSDGDRRSEAGAPVRISSDDLGPASEDAAEDRSVRLVLRAADGRPIREALASWGMAQHVLTCVGTIQAPRRYQYGSIPAGRAPFRFATINPTLVDGETVFDVVAKRRPCFLSVLVSGVVVKTGEVEESTAELVLSVSENDLQAAMGNLRLCLIGEDRNEPPRARAYLRRGTEIQLNAEVTQDGCLQFDSVPPGDYRLSIYANRYASHFQNVRVEPSSTQDLGQVILEPPVLLSGALVGADMRFLANRQVSIQSVDRTKGALRSVELRQVSTDGRGNFKVFDLAAGEYTLHVVEPTGRQVGTIANWPLSQALLVDTTRQPAEVELELEDAHGLVLRSALERESRVELRDAKGITVARVFLGRRGVRNIGVIAGRYEVVVSSGGVLVERTFLDTPPMKTLNIGK